MRAMALIALGLFCSTALAGSELQLKSSMPVNLLVDGESVGTVQPIEALRIDIAEGVHNLQIKGLMGKELYNRDLIFDDNTRTELHWQRKELRLGQVVPLDPKRQLTNPAAPPAAPVAPPTAPAPQAAAAPVAPAPPVVQQPAVAQAPPVVQQPVVQQPAAQQPQVVYVPVQAQPVQQAPTYASTVHPPNPAAGANGSVVIQATENLDLQITHGTQLLRISVENGELVLRDSS